MILQGFKRFHFEGKFRKRNVVTCSRGLASANSFILTDTLNWVSVSSKLCCVKYVRIPVFCDPYFPVRIVDSFIFSLYGKIQVNLQNTCILAYFTKCCSNEIKVWYWNVVKNKTAFKITWGENWLIVLWSLMIALTYDPFLFTLHFWI